MKTTLALILLSFLVVGCKEEIRLPFGKSSSPKRSIPDGPSSSNGAGMSSQKPQPVEGTGNGNGAMDLTSFEGPTQNAARLNHVLEQFELAVENERVVTTSPNYGDVAQDFRSTSFDWLSQYDAWNALNLPSQMTIFAPYAVLYFDTSKTPEHLLMYISQTDQGVFTINLQIIPSRYTNYSHVLKLLTDGVSPVFTNITVKDGDEQTPFILNMEKFRNNKPLQPYSTEQQLDPDGVDTRLIENLNGPVQGDNTTSTALGKLLLCKESLATVLEAESAKEDICELEERTFNLQFAFDLEGNFLIRFLSQENYEHNKMIASVNLTSDKIILERSRKKPTGK